MSSITPARANAAPLRMNLGPPIRILPKLGAGSSSSSRSATFNSPKPRISPPVSSLSISREDRERVEHLDGDVVVGRRNDNEVLQGKIITLTWLIFLIIGDHTCSASGSQKTLRKQFQWWRQQSENQRQCTEKTIIFSTDFKTEWGKWQYGDNVLCHNNSQLIIAAS